MLAVAVSAFFAFVVGVFFGSLTTQLSYEKKRAEKLETGNRALAEAAKSALEAAQRQQVLLQSHIEAAVVKKAREN